MKILLRILAVGKPRNLRAAVTGEQLEILKCHALGNPATTNPKAIGEQNHSIDLIAGTPGNSPPQPPPPILVLAFFPATYSWDKVGY
jgi:hypothetical protein